MADVLILGARRGSLGAAIREACVVEGYGALTVGISGEEYVHIDDVENWGEWDHVVCTIGVNRNDLTYDEAFQANVVTPINWWRTWLTERGPRSAPGSFVFISSNSAYIARSPSGPYCASKAALTMAVRCEARFVSKSRADFGPTYVYSYEPCWIEDTTMSREIQKGLPFGDAMHRVPDGHGLRKVDFAQLIVSNLKFGESLHSSNLRVDLGEQ